MDPEERERIRRDAEQARRDLEETRERNRERRAFEPVEKKWSPPEKVTPTARAPRRKAGSSEMSKAWLDLIERRIDAKLRPLAEAIGRAMAEEAREAREHLEQRLSEVEAGHRRVGLEGAYPAGDQWISAIRIDDQMVFLGTYASEQDAHLVFLNKQRDLAKEARRA